MEIALLYWCTRFFVHQKIFRQFESMDFTLHQVGCQRVILVNNFSTVFEPGTCSQFLDGGLFSNPEGLPEIIVFVFIQMTTSVISQGLAGEACLIACKKLLKLRLIFR